jgi:hypothetical protein
MALVGIDNSNGVWEYTLNGSLYAPIAPQVASGRVLLLSADSNTRIRFVPNANYFGTVGGLTYRAWDGADENAEGTSILPSAILTRSLSQAVATSSIAINAVNDAPTDALLSNNSVPENLAVGAMIGTLSVNDTELTDKRTLELVFGTGSTDNDRFVLVGNELRLAGTLDFETRPTLSIRVRATDQGGLTIEKVFTISVTDINEPVVLTRANANVSGNVSTLLTNSGTWNDPESATVTLSASIGVVVKNVDGTWNWSYQPTVAVLSQVVTISASDGTNVSTTTFNVTAYATIATRGLVYVGATGTSASTSLATDKVALLPGQSSTFANYTNYSRGLNGLVIDVVGLPATVTNGQLAASLQFANWNGIAAAGFVALPGTAVPTVSIVAGGVAGSTRVRITFPDNTVQNTWLRVTVVANANTVLAANDVFYYGNVIGELDFGNTATRLRVNGQDAALILANQSPGANSAGVTNKFDLDRNGRVNGQDYAILLANQQAAGIVAPITAPSARVASRSSLVGGNPSNNWSGGSPLVSRNNLSPSPYLGTSFDGKMITDGDAAGWGWSVDVAMNAVADVKTSAQHSIDLMSEVLHELGHPLGPDDDINSSEDDVLNPGYDGLNERGWETSVDDFFSEWGSDSQRKKKTK